MDHSTQPKGPDVRPDTPSPARPEAIGKISVRILGRPEIQPITNGVITTYGGWYDSLAEKRAAFVESGRVPTNEQMSQGIFRGTPNTRLEEQ